ncbi:hypothetical protein CJ195_09765 [Bacillus sp. UMB0899]|uniref:heme-dependent oxidative N-demethylase family protein n=1 Tax=Metabacillus schmidteae TaxID=2730405 RepID=UPI000C7FDE2A|nr:DUF3445 domain-containing protein [Metabacillus schmidteae]PMC37884.1 hypothetical protein CJ195_09765 [Bacillus sp. UMB0899]
MTEEKVKHIDTRPLIERFPFPFKADSYRYSNNAESLIPSFVLDVTPEYFHEISEKRRVLDSRNEQAFQSFPHSMDAQWELLEMIIDEMTERFPTFFSVKKMDDLWTFQNHLLKEKYTFVFGDSTTLPYEPLDFIGRHVQEDLVYLANRDGDLYMDAGQLCFPANWSIAFNLGMTFTEFHSPVPFTDRGFIEKVRNFLLRMEPGKPFTRLNWTITVEHILDTFPENYDEWGPKKEKITTENIGELVHLRVEDQRLFRLPKSNGILFSIHTSLLPIEELQKNEEWLTRFYHVLTDLPDHIAQYKGFLSYKDKMIQYLEEILQKKAGVLK